MGVQHLTPSSRLAASIPGSATPSCPMKFQLRSAGSSAPEPLPAGGMHCQASQFEGHWGVEDTHRGGHRSWGASGSLLSIQSEERWLACAFPSE